jgi:hypothetical protein
MLCTLTTGPAAHKQPCQCPQGRSCNRDRGMVSAMGSGVGCKGSDAWSVQRSSPLCIRFGRACRQLFHSCHHGASSFSPVSCCQRLQWHTAVHAMQAHAPHMFMDMAQTDRQDWRRLKSDVVSQHNYVPVWAEKGVMGGVVWTAPGSRWGDAETLMGSWPPPTQGKQARFLKWTVFVRDGFLVMRQDNRNDARYAPMYVWMGYFGDGAVVPFE